MKKKSFVVKILFLILLFQITLYLLANFSLRLPKFITLPISKLVFEDKDIKIDYEYLEFSLNGEFTFSNLKISFFNKYEIKCNEGQIWINYNGLIDDQNKIINSLFLKNINLYSENINKSDISVNLLRFESSTPSFYFIDADLKVFGNSIKSNGNIELQQIFGSEENKKVNLSETFKRIDEFCGDHIENFKKLSIQNFNFILSNGNFSKLFTKINNIEGNRKEEKLIILKDLILDTSIDHNLSKIRNIASINYISTNDLTNILVNDTTGKIDCIWNHNSKFTINAFISSGDTELNGKIKGLIRPVDLIYQKSSAGTCLQLITSNKSVESCIKFTESKNQKRLEGFANFKPNLFNLEFLKNEEYLKVVTGDSLQLKFNRNPDATTTNFETLLSVCAENFSALETPSGNYDFIGEIDKDLKIEIREALGIMGNSKVQGSYSQGWNPHSYEFRLKGFCFPPDIKNWLGNWWSNIWKHFSFPEKTPYGDFIISGIWGGEIGNSRTIGFVDSEQLNYKDFRIIDADVLVKVDNNSTKISSDRIQHEKGNFSGKLTFPRKHLNSPVFLSFKVDGQYPLNDARTIFGEQFEKTVEDINATSLFCFGSGEILRENEDANTRSNFKLEIQSTDPFTVNGFKINQLHGKIDKKDNITKGNFPFLKIADGQGQLNFISETNGTEDKIKLDFSLNDASKNLLFENIIRANKAGTLKKFSQNENEFILNEDNNSNGGSMSLAIQAEGPLKNPLQFEGTGIIQIKEPKIGQINFFGKISEGLSNLKIPLPSGAFSFNQLTVPFKLDNETMFFDNMILTGPLSKVKASGSFNLSSQTVDLIARLSLVGNLPLPIIKNLLQFADPISKIAEIKMTGNYLDPKWELIFSSK